MRDEFDHPAYTRHVTKLYGTLILSVLLFAACGGSPETNDVDSARPEERPNGDQPSTAPPATILFFGTSLTAGFGVSPDSAYPALIQNKIDSAGLNYRVVNAGLSGDTSSGGVTRLPWVLREPISVMVLELGANDGLRGLPTDHTRENLAAIIDQTRIANPGVTILLAGMQMPPNLGPDYTRRFREIFSDLAREKEIDLIPFLLDGVGGIRNMNQGDGIHPNEAGHRIMAETVWQHLRPVLERQPGLDEAA